MQRRSQGCARDKIYRGLMNLKKNSWLGLAICKTLELVKRKIRKPMSSIVYVWELTQLFWGTIGHCLLGGFRERRVSANCGTEVFLIPGLLCSTSQNSWEPKRLDHHHHLPSPPIPFLQRKKRKEKRSFVPKKHLNVCNIIAEFLLQCGEGSLVFWYPNTFLLVCPSSKSYIEE